MLLRYEYVPVWLHGCISAWPNCFDCIDATYFTMQADRLRYIPFSFGFVCLS